MIEAAIFDFDGTLADTLPLHYQSYKTVFEECQLKLTEEHFYKNIGGIAREVIPKLLMGQNCPLSVLEIHNRKKYIFSQLINRQDIVKLETAKLLDVFKGHLKMAVASAGSASSIKAIINKFNWEHYFDVILTGEDVSNGKPSPEVFLLAANKLNTLPQNCIVFEDSVDGINGAKAAGMSFFDVNLTVNNHAF